MDKEIASFVRCQGVRRSGTNHNSGKSNQEIWLQNLRWDDPIPNHIQVRWSVFQNQLNSVERIKLPR